MSAGVTREDRSLFKTLSNMTLLAAVSAIISQPSSDLAPTAKPRGLKCGDDGMSRLLGYLSCCGRSGKKGKSEDVEIPDEFLTKLSLLKVPEVVPRNISMTLTPCPRNSSLSHKTI